MLKSEKKQKNKTIFDIVPIYYKFLTFTNMSLFLAEHFYLSKLLIKCLLLNININLNVLFFFSSLSVESSVEE